MGGKDSKPFYITYEDAVKRVSDTELRRLKDAFKRTSTIGGYMTRQLFIREVLGDGVPNRLAEQIYAALGAGQRGLTFKDLIVGLVLITRGSLEERIKFIFALYANESLTHVQKEELDNLVLITEGQVPTALSVLFKDTDRVGYDVFRRWLLANPDVTSLTKWLLYDYNCVSLSNDSETPTFYQTLAGVTHLEEADIIELEKRYWILKAQSKSGYFDVETFKPLISPPVPDDLCQGVFMAFDENRDNHIDFKEMACGVSACCRGPITERQKFCFKIFDRDHDGMLNQDELICMVRALLQVRKSNRSQEEMEHDCFADIDPETIANEILELYDADQDGRITTEEYLVWTVNHRLPEDLVNLLFQVCHIVLGLKPQSRHEEGSIINGWIAREERRGLQVGQTWYLIAMAWWKSWHDYVTYKPGAGTTSPTSSSQSLTLPNNKGNNRNGACKSKTAKANSCSTFTHTTKSWSDNPNVVVTSVNPQESVKNSLPNGTVLHKSNSLPRNLPSSSITNASVNLLANHSLTPSQSPGVSPAPSPSIGKKFSYSGTYIPHKPGAIDNSSLIVPNVSKVMSLTNEGGRLKRGVPLAKSRDFELVPEPIWKALHSWYGGSLALPRNVILPTSFGISRPEIEMFPINVRLMRHQTVNQKPQQSSSFAGMVAGFGGMTWNAAGFNANATSPRRYLAYTAAFSRKHTLKQVYDFLCTRLRINREDMHLWKIKDEHNMTLLEEEELSMEALGIEDSMSLLIEIRNKDLTWPEEMSLLAKAKNACDRKQAVPTEKGATGLNNLGNTCFMNSAVQCVSNTWPLTYYFTSGMHRYELNRENPLGMKGHVAQRYGDLVKDLWSGTAKNIAPLRLRWTIGKYSPRFKNFQQHDSQELLAFLLDGLHEDLNRVHDKPYVELKDSDGRPDEEVAKEAWDNHVKRNQSIIVDLFHGQLKSQVRCIECGHISVRFDPFSYMSLPLPMDSCIHLEIIVMKLDGSVPVKYGLRLNMDEKYKTLKKQLSLLSDIPQEQLLLVEIYGATVKSFPEDQHKIKTMLGGNLYAYELPPLAELETMSADDEKQMNGSQTSDISNKSLDTLPPVDNPLTNNSYDKDTDIRINGTPQRYQVCCVRSSDVTPQSPRPGQAIRNTAGSPRVQQPTSPQAVYNGIDGLQRFDGFLVAMHRKMIRMDVYYLSSQKTRPSLFGIPLILPCDEETTNQDLYQYVWTQVSRLVTQLPPSEASSPNHAQDCDDSLNYEYPFTVKIVSKDGLTCATCPWFKFCRGCKIDCDLKKFSFASSYIAIDWEPTAIHLRYQTSQEKAYLAHGSVELSRRQQTEPIDLHTCLNAFTKEEELGEDELYYCSKCKAHRLAAKKLDIWRLPPILIIHLKRFQFLNGRWVKSHKIVKFPREDFDPTNYLADTLEGRKRLLSHNGPTNHDSDNQLNTETITNAVPSTIDNVNKCSAEQNGSQSQADSNSQLDLQDINMTEQLNDSSQNKGVICERKMNNNNCNKISDDQHQLYHHDYTDARYNLYAISSHTGILGGGHYVAYAKNPNNEKWYCYNDSSCKEIQPSQVDTDSAYILFYERVGLNHRCFMPGVDGKEPDLAEIDDDFESDFKKVCTIQ
ncbi:ubiquitin carboxyl-terminal hydrolase 32-like [Tubulanus polymorphus]|uniref:ubiquitin carboxyl-terminal hydrolase 32-like n=1 Tax=Tubulanus polymorphus TaxID=672921 RepID=UPI003DA55C2A